MRNWSSLLILALIIACSPEGAHQPIPKGNGGPDVASTGAPGYDQVKPLFAQYCSECHPSRSAPNWLEYNEAQRLAKNGRLFERVFRAASMPPPGSPQAASISDNDRKKIAAWAQAGGPRDAVANVQPSSASPEPVTKNPTIQSCFQCHGPDGAMEEKPHIPSIAGQNAPYIINQLNNFKWGARSDPTNMMSNVAARLSKEEMAQAAEFFSKRTLALGPGPGRLKAAEAKLYQHGEKLAAQACNSCHMSADYGYSTTEPLLPILVGQTQQYLIDQLINFRDSQRKSGIMNEYARTLSNDDIEALATYFSNVRVPQVSSQQSSPPQR